MGITELHKKFVTYLDTHNVLSSDRITIERELEFFLNKEGIDDEQGYLRQRLVSRMWGLGALDGLVVDEQVSEIMVNGPNEIWFEKNGKIEKSSVFFDSADDVIAMVNRLVSSVGRRLDEATPLVDARLPDGSRLNAIIPPLSRSGPVVTIRRFPHVPFTLQRAVVGGSMTLAMANFLEACVKAKHAILVSGATGSGKTSLLNALAAKIPSGERIITIEDTAEIKLTHGHVVQLEARASNIEGQGEVSIRTLVKNALRMRPDRIIVGEVRGGEALDMLQAMNTGHRGSITTVHANAPEEALERLTTMALMADVGLPDGAVRAQVAASIAYVVQVARLPDGTRRVMEISEVAPRVRQDKNGFMLETLYKYYSERHEHRATKILPARLDYFEAAGIFVNPDWFTR